MRALLAGILLFIACSSPAQVLAHPGSRATTVNADPWWKTAIFYQLPPSPTDCKDLTVRLDSLRALNIDALILPAPELPTPGSNGPMPSLDDFDDLVRQASAHGIRILLTLHPTSAAADLSGVARFWLNHGIAGLSVAPSATSSPEQMQAALQSVRQSLSSAPGQRILLSDLDPAQSTPAASAKSRRPPLRRASSTVPQLLIDARPAALASLDASTLRPLLQQDIVQPNLLIDLRTPTSAAAPSLADAVAAIELLTQPAALIDSSANLVLQPTVEPPKPPDDEPAKPATPPPPQTPPGTFLPYVPYVPPPKPRAATTPKPPPADPLTNFYSRLASLHHDSAVLRSGSITLLDFDAQNALVWIAKPPAKAPRLTAPVVVVCNLSSTPLQLSLTDAIKHLDLHGFYLRTLVRTDSAMGAQDINSINVPAYGVYIGELHR